MSLPSGIKRRGNTYSARYVLPRSVQRIAGRHDLVQALGTSSLSDAVELAGPIIAGWKAWAVAVGKGDMRHEPEVYVRRAEVAHRLIRDGIDQWSPELIVERAREVFAMQQAGAITANDVEAQVGRDVERYIVQQQDAGAQVDVEGVRRAHRAALGQLGVTVADSLETYLHERAGDLTAQSLAETEKRCRVFVNWVGSNVEMATVTRVTAGQFVAKVIQPRPVSRVTKTKEVSACRGWFQWAMLRGEVDANPFDRMQATLKKSKRGQEAPRRAWTEGELLVVLRGLKDDRREPLLYPLTLLALYTGMRLNEVCALTVADYDAEAEVIHVREGKSAAAVRVVPVHPAIRELLVELTANTGDGFLLPGLVPGGPDRKRGHGIGKTWGRRIRSLGITDRRLVFHGLRATFITAALNAGAPKEVVQQVAGHEREGVTMNSYARVLSLDLCRQAVGGVSFGDLSR
ncbi:tyrosine-type recombinase/integrase [Stenotrophomonas sp. CASM110]|uniref:tyrosine-type recombinase/integrase n=1 Tax=Stenotrophomonas sp. CASM110 TaxID=3111510 RepID=UPI003BF8D68B